MVASLGQAVSQAVERHSRTKPKARIFIFLRLDRRAEEVRWGKRNDSHDHRGRATGVLPPRTCGRALKFRLLIYKLADSPRSCQVREENYPGGGKRLALQR